MNDVPANLILVGVILAKAFVISRLLLLYYDMNDLILSTAMLRTNSTTRKSVLRRSRSHGHDQHSNILTNITVRTLNLHRLHVR
jgi:hypothetical protein